MNYRTIDVPDDNGFTRFNRTRLYVNSPANDDIPVKWEECQFTTQPLCRRPSDPLSPDGAYCVFHAQVIESRMRRFK